MEKLIFNRKFTYDILSPSAFAGGLFLSVEWRLERVVLIKKIMNGNDECFF